jgi:hypothetical protein
VQIQKKNLLNLQRFWATAARKRADFCCSIQSILLPQPSRIACSQNGSGKKHRGKSAVPRARRARVMLALTTATTTVHISCIAPTSIQILYFF